MNNSTAKKQELISRLKSIAAKHPTQALGHYIGASGCCDSTGTVCGD
jgi:hypothetical protein